MSDVITGDLAEEQPVDEPRFLPPEVSRPLAADIAEVLLFARARGLDADAMADRVVVFIAPMLIDKDVQLEQAGAALAKQVAEVQWLSELANNRHAAAVRLREELATASRERDEAMRRLRRNEVRVSLDVDTPTIVRWAADVAQEKTAEELSNWVMHVRSSFTGVDELIEQMEARLDQLTGDERPVESPGSGCPAHGEHPHAGMKCLDCASCVDGAS